MQKAISHIFSLLLLAGLFSQAQAQKVIKLEKIDKDGKSTIKEIEIDDEEDNIFIFENDELKAIEEDIHLDFSNEGTHKRVKIKITKNGEEQTMEWDGEGEMPEDIKKYLEEGDIQLFHLEGDNGFTFHKSHGNSFNFKHRGKHGKHQKHNKFFFDCEDDSAFLGIAINSIHEIEMEDGEERIIEQATNIIHSVTEDSPAEKAGLKSGDQIIQINDLDITSFDDIVDAMAQYKPGDEVAIKYIRDAKELNSKAVLSTRKNSHANFDWIMQMPEGCNENKSVKSFKKIIIIEDDNEEYEEDEAFEEEDSEMESEERAQTLELESFIAFPNPSNQYVRVQFQGAAVPTDILLTDSSGKQVYGENITNFSGQFDKTLDLKNSAKGTIVISISQNGKRFVEQIVLQ